MTEDEFITECERIVYDEDWAKEMFADLKDGREFFLEYYRKGYTPHRMMDELESEEY